ncbi:trypco2 family protein [Propionicicella superfundia]|uniref:trypco2 family protein n=1 Tax=Propionicicella superfundia TaxID=348582 RepID=UPI0012EB1CAA|nr:trypco2 family protein [Propionicicella superfundia]
MEASIDLADAVEALRRDLAEAARRAENQGLQFEIDAINLTIQATVSRGADGKLGWGVLGVGASASTTSSHTISISLLPKGETADFRIASVGRD